MEIYCPKCGEPWDIDSLHDVEDPDYAKVDEFRGTQHFLTFTEAYHLFRSKGCGEVFGTRCEPPVDEESKFRSHLSAELMSLYGDDVDGVAADLEDFEYLYGKELG
jgi:hypothetical protein